MLCAKKTGRPGICQHVRSNSRSNSNYCCGPTVLATSCLLPDDGPWHARNVYMLAVLLRLCSFIVHDAMAHADKYQDFPVFSAQH